MLEPWHGDLDGMVARRYVRMLVTFNRTNFFIDRGQQKGLTYEGGKAFEDYLNRKLKTGAIRVNLVFIPVPRLGPRGRSSQWH
jgi:membrane-bound lytic murein transglycosylase MltF